MILFITGFSIGVVVGAFAFAYAMTRKVKTHDYTFVIENKRGRGKWVSRASKYYDEFLANIK